MAEARQSQSYMGGVRSGLLGPEIHRSQEVLGIGYGIVCRLEGRTDTLRCVSHVVSIGVPFEHRRKARNEPTLMMGNDVRCDNIRELRKRYGGGRLVWAKTCEKSPNKVTPFA